MTELLQVIIRELELFCDPLKRAATSPGGVTALLSAMDVAGPNDLAAQIEDVVNAVKLAQWRLDSPPNSPEQVIELLDSARAAFSALQGIGDALQLSSNPALGPLIETPAVALFGRLSYIWLSRRFPIAYGVLSALGCISRGRYVSEANRVVLPWLDPLAIRALIEDPATHLKSTYAHDGWQDVTRLRNAMASACGRLQPLAAALGCEIIPPSADLDEGDVASVLTRRFKNREGVASKASLFITPLLEGDRIDGWGLAPRGTLSFEHSVGNWLIALEGTTRVSAVVVAGGEIETEPVGVDYAAANVRCKSSFASAALLLGTQGGSHISVGTLECVALGELDDADWQLGLVFELRACEVAVKPANPDAFLAKLISQGIEGKFDLGMGWSSQVGFSLRGSGTASVDIPIARDVGPLHVETVHLAAAASGANGLALTVAITAALQLGPVNASVKRVGLGTNLGLTDGSGNFGLFEVGNPFFVPPTGAGIAIDAGGISGGGFVEYTEADQNYAGILALNFGEIALTAIGLISTKMPDGSKGFALLIIIGVEFSPPIQLSFGFTLSGVGGLLAVNRTMAVEALRAGLRQNTLDSILFPEDPILNAPKIISDLKSVFPVQEGRYVLGPMVKIGWGSPNVIQADVGIFIELPDPVRVVLLGAISAFLPEPSDPIVELHIDVLGVIEFGKKTLGIDATIYDSKILTYSLYGDAALRMGWGDKPQFAMSLGGFHPKFSPPAGFPELRRLTLDLSSGRTLQLTCKVYQALTSNSLQFGARLDAHAEAAGATLDGDMSFDALIYFSPFSFVVDMSGGMTARYKGYKLCGVRLELSLAGPTPWHARGTATFEILCWDVGVSFDKSWGRSTPAALPPFNAWDHLQTELNRPESWGAALPGMTATEALRKLEADEDELVVHPAGTVQLKQRLLPLELELDKVANAPIEGYRRFRIAKIEMGSSAAPMELAVMPIDEHFARAQFLDVSNAQKLSLPSFEKLPAGVGGTSSALLVVGTPVAFPLTYESIVIDGPKAPGPTTAKVGWALAQRLLRRNAAARAARRAGGLATYLLRGRTPLVRTQETGYLIVDASDLTPIPKNEIAGNDGSKGHMRTEQVLEKYIASHPSHRGELMLVEAHEASVVLAPLAGEVSLPEPQPPEAAVLAHYYFTPAVRRGLAAAIGLEETAEADASRERAVVRVRALATADDGAASVSLEKTIHLLGPGDVLGFDARVVARTDPRPNVGDFEPNFFPMIEFTESDYPWRFSPAVPSGGAPVATNAVLVGQGSLQPWIVLVVLEEGSEFTFGSKGAEGSPPWIKVGGATAAEGQLSIDAGSVLPDLSLASRWAHVHLTGEREEGDGEVSVEPELHAIELGTQERTNPDRVVSRLLCARRLKARTKYHAFVVPAFKLGLVAAGRAVAEASDTALTLAWSSDTAIVDLPYYYHWEFGTSARGDFEYLVRLLEPRVLQKLGVRQMDCSAPGYGMPPVERLGEDGAMSPALDLEGALASLDTSYTDWGFANANTDAPGTAEALQVELSRNLLNKPVADREPRTISLPAPTSSGIAGIVVTLRPTDPLTGSAGFDADVEWETAPDQGARLEWGATPAYGTTIVSAAVSAGKHRVMIDGLAASVTHHLRISAIDGAGVVTGTTSDLFFAAPTFPLPVVVPPIYGARHTGRSIVLPPTSKTTWFDELNLDPRHRAAAGYGALVVERQQEPLVASMWDQLGDIDEANEILRLGQLGREAALSVFERLKQLPEGDFLRITTPIHDRVLFAYDHGRATVARHLAGSKIPLAAFDPALRRVQRRRGPIRKTQRWSPAAHDDMLGRLNADGPGALVPVGPVPDPAGTWSLCSITDRLSIDPTPPPSVTEEGKEAAHPGKDEQASASSDAEKNDKKKRRPRRPLRSLPRRGSDSGCVMSAVVTVSVEVSIDCAPAPKPKGPRFCEEHITCALLKREIAPLLKTVHGKKLPGGMTLPSGADLDAMLEAMCGALDGFLAPDPPEDDLPPADLRGIISALEVTLDPRTTVRDRVLSRLEITPTVLARRKDGDELRPLLGCPDFPQPMYEPLRDISQDLILPGIETVPQNTIGLLKSNGRFVESYLLALNHAFGGEARWRGAPIEPRCTYFRQFWDVEDTIAAAAPTNAEAEHAVRENYKDIRRIAEWGEARLGKNDARAGAATQTEALVLLVRGDVLKKYPNTVVYAIAARGSTTSPVPGLDEFSEHFEDGELPAEKIFPIFSGSLGADLTFLGFPFSEADARGESDYFPKSFYIVLEERVSEARFGIDEGGQAGTPTTSLNDWDDLNWDHFRMVTAGDTTAPLPAGRYIDAITPSATAPGAPWSDGSAAIARITLQKPVRIAVHASRMLPKAGETVT